MSILTGFPFGFYEHNAGMGPKIYVVPVAIGLGFYSIHYPTWTLANAPFREGGGLFGIPMSNYVCWYIVAFAIFIAWALYLKATNWTPRPVSPGYWYLAAAFWAAQGLQFPLVALTREATPVVYDASGWAFRSKDILDSAGLLGIATMVSFAVLAAIVVWRRSGDPAAN